MKKILIADDLPAVRRLVRLTLKSPDYQIFEAENAEQAVEIARTEKPDLIIMDIMMPGKFDGLQAVRIIKESPEIRGCKIVMLTAKGQDSDREHTLKAGADAFFAKPFSPLELIKKVEEVLG